MHNKPNPRPSFLTPNSSLQTRIHEGKVSGVKPDSLLQSSQPTVLLHGVEREPGLPSLRDVCPTHFMADGNIAILWKYAVMIPDGPDACCRARKNENVSASLISLHSLILILTHAGTHNQP